MTEVRAIVLAAGAGRRFGGPKQVAPLGGRPLLAHAIGSVLAAGLARPVVVLGARAAEVRAAVDLSEVEVVEAAGWETGPGASLKAGLVAAGAGGGAGADGPDGAPGAVLVVLGDQPLVGPAAIRRVLAARSPGRAAVRATYGGEPGHPVVLEPVLFARILAQDDGRGAGPLLRACGAIEVPCDDVADPRDVDTVEDLRACARLAGLA